MANDLTARPWKIDTAGAGVLWQPQVFIKFIEWIDLAAGAINADSFVITDRNSKTIIQSTNQAVKDVQTLNIENWFEGLIVPTLTAGGILYIHIK